MRDRDVARFTGIGRVSRLTALVVFAALAVVAPARAGQMASHDYLALMARPFLTGSARRAVDANQAAYLSGAQGPDICGVVMAELNFASKSTVVGGETHYSPRKALLALNLLDSARTDAEKAYALGWISHYVNDIFVHDVVNQYGGFYELYAPHHKELEMLETKHVFSKHGDVVTEAVARSAPTTGGDAKYASFVFSAYQRTFPEETRYQEGSGLAGDRREYFCKRYVEASTVCSHASFAFYTTHRAGTGAHGNPESVAFPPMPSTKAYELMQKAVEIKVTGSDGGALHVLARVNDSKLYGRFTADWEVAIKQALERTRAAFAAASAYLDAPEGPSRAALRRKLLAAIPSANLDQPRDSFDAAAAKPGNAAAKTLQYSVVLRPEGGPAVALSGASPAVRYGETHFAGSQVGTVSWDIPLPAGIKGGQYSLTVALTGLDAVKTPAYRGVDWTVAEGGYSGSQAKASGGRKLLTMRTYHPNKQLFQEYTYYVGQGGAQVKHGRYREWNKQGVQTDEMSVVEGKTEGVWRHWWPTGELYFEETYLHGARTGPYTRYFKSGRVETTGANRDGNQVGIWTNYYENGQKRTESDWGDGGYKPKSERAWTETGRESPIVGR